MSTNLHQTQQESTRGGLHEQEQTEKSESATRVTRARETSRRIDRNRREARGVASSDQDVTWTGVAPGSLVLGLAPPAASLAGAWP